MRPDIAGAIRIAWAADGYQSITVSAPRRSRAELEEFARGVADEALLNRSVRELHTALRRRFGATFEIDRRPSPAPADAELGSTLALSLDPPRGEPNPDPYEDA
jgi:hypothetical protein